MVRETFSSFYFYESRFAEIDLGSVRLGVGPCHSVPVDYYAVSLNGKDKDIVAEIDDFSIEPLERLKMAVKLAYRLLSKKLPVAICCSGGCGRTGTAAILLMIAYFNIPLYEALRKFRDARDCGPESLSQKLLLAYAEVLRRKGLRGDLLINSLVNPSKEINIEGIKVTNGSYIEVDGIRIRQTVARKLGEEIINMILGSKDIAIPIDCDLLESILDKLGKKEAIDKIKEVKQLLDVWEEAEKKANNVSVSFSSYKSSRKNSKSSKKRGKNKESSKSFLEDWSEDYSYYRGYYRYDSSYF